MFSTPSASRTLRARIADRREIPREISERAFPSGAPRRIGDLFDGRAGLGDRVGLAGGGADHAVAIGIVNQPEPALLRVPHFEADAQMIFADSHLFVLAAFIQTKFFDSLPYSRSVNLEIDKSAARERK